MSEHWCAVRPTHACRVLASVLCSFVLCSLFWASSSIVSALNSRSLRASPSGPCTWGPSPGRVAMDFTDGRPVRRTFGLRFAAICPRSHAWPRLGASGAARVCVLPSWPSCVVSFLLDLLCISTLRALHVKLQLWLYGAPRRRATTNHRLRPGPAQGKPHRPQEASVAALQNQAMYSRFFAVSCSLLRRRQSRCFRPLCGGLRRNPTRTHAARSRALASRPCAACVEVRPGCSQTLMPSNSISAAGPDSRRSSLPLQPLLCSPRMLATW